jgi:hypothetical protein
MAFIQYTALRSVVAPHIVTLVYSLEIGATEAIRSSSVQKTPIRSIGGAMEVLRDYSDKQWTITFEPVAGSQLDFLREFLDSTDSGESFQIDIYGNSSFMRTMRRFDEGYTEEPFMRIGSEATDLFQVSITTIEA